MTFESFPFEEPNMFIELFGILLRRAVQRVEYEILTPLRSRQRLHFCCVASLFRQTVADPYRLICTAAPMHQSVPELPSLLRDPVFN